MIFENTYTESDLNKNTIKIALIGCGGTGSFLINDIIAISRAVTMLNPDSKIDCHLYDPSHVRESNLVRQNFFAPQLNMNKAEALAWTANNLHGQKFVAHSEEFPLHQIPTFDILITALDRAKPRLDIYNKGMDIYAKTLWIDCGNDSHSGNIVIGELGKFKTNIRLPTVCDFFDYSEISDDDADIKSCSAIESLTRQKLGVNATCARIGGQIPSNLILDGKLTTHGALFDIHDMSTTPIEVNGLEWEIFGYTQKLEAVA